MNDEDIFVWPDGEWCLREEFSDVTNNKSDDYIVLRFGTPEHDQFCKDNELT